MNNIETQIKGTIRDIPDFPKPGIVFKDIAPLLSDVAVSQNITQALTCYWSGREIDVIVGIESRGFMWGHSLAQAMKVPFVPIRKKGKLPGASHSFKYDLEYGSAEIEIHQDAVGKGQKVLIHDDLLATGGTAIGAAELISLCGAQTAGFSFIVELDFLKGRQKLEPYANEVHALANY